ncbi:MAG: hypothetical protein EPO32_00075 [Anaerolineae bacterium]|nr:MAG: hypothetical protein EPO32_00075 [Anaerolineae bacterium]
MNQTMEQQKTWRDALRHPLVIAAIIIALGLITAGLIFAAGNSVPESGAGDGTGVVSGYTVTAIDWDIQAANPTLLDNVVFTVTPTAGAGNATEVYVTVDAGANWITCTNVLTVWTCDFTATDPTVLSAVALRIVAIQ